MKNTLLNFENFEINETNKVFNIKNYNSIDLKEIREYLDSLPKNYFVHLKVNEGSKIEKVLFDFYGSTQYYDLVMFLNDREMLFDMPYSYDVIIDAVETDLEEYRLKVFGNNYEKFSENSKERLRKMLDKNYSDNNEKFSILKVPTLSKIYTIIRKINSIFDTQKDMYNLLDEEIK